METVKRALDEVGRQLAEADKNGREYWTFVQTENYLTKMLLIEERIATAERDLISAKGIRMNACEQLLKLGRSSSEDDYVKDGILATKHSIETSVEMTVDLRTKLELLRTEKDNLVTKRVMERSTQH
jgi:hypothetical protein